MIRRVSIVVFAGFFALAPLSGCGLGLRKMQGESFWRIGTVSRTYKYPSHRVALATLEAMRSALATSDFAPDKDSIWASASDLLKPSALPKQEGEGQLPADFPAFWTDWKLKGGGRSDRQLMVLVACQFEGKTQDNEPVEVTVKMRPDGAIVTAHVGKRGSAVVSDLILNQVADNLAHPTFLPGSREEADALRAFFDGPEGRAKLPSLVKPPPPKAEETKKADAKK